MKFLTLVLALAAASPALAQQSVQTKLDECIVREQKGDAAAGGILGFLSHFSVGVSRSSGTAPPPDNGKPQSSGGGGSMAAATAAGSAMGLAAAYFNAMKDCLEDHPDWLPASKFERKDEYKAVVARVGYEASQGVVLRPEAVDMPAEARPETKFQVRSRFLVLTPDGGEASVYIERRLFAIADGQEQQLTIPAQPEEKRTLPAGEHEDVINLLIPKDVPLGVSYRVEFIVGAPRKQGTMVSATIKVL